VVDRTLPRQPYRVLFLCTGNSARSIMSECILNRFGAGRFEAFSAGSHPTGAVHPMALRLLQQYNYRTDGLRSKSWDEFAGPDAPPLDFVFTLCDDAANEVCPGWPGQPMTAHWGVQDPAAFDGPDDKKLRLFRDVYFRMERRIQIFTNLPIASLDKLSLQRRLEDIGKRAADPNDAAA
jgi:protein-tyrosine-phosphatase